MSIKIHRISFNLSPEVLQWVSTQTGYRSTIQGLGPDAGSFTNLEFDHADTAAENSFKRELANKIGLIDDNLMKYTKGFANDALVYTTDTPFTKTNVGTTAFVDVYTATGSAGKPFAIDTSGFSIIKMLTLWNKTGTAGIHTIQVVDINNPGNILLSYDLNSTGINWSADDVMIPAALVDTVKVYKLQVKSTVVADLPIFEGCRIYLRR